MTKEERKMAQWAEQLTKGNFNEEISEIISNLTDPKENALFTHFIVNVFPMFILSQISDKEFDDLLDFNHFGNKLIFKFSK